VNGPRNLSTPSLHRPRAARWVLAIGLIGAVISACTDDTTAVTTWPVDHPVAVVVVGNDTVMYAERLTGRVIRRDLTTPASEPSVVGEVDVDASGEQRGLIGLALLDNRVFAAWIRPGDLRLVVGDVQNGALIWEGPVTDDKAIGGHLDVLDGGLVLGLGELVNDPKLAGTIVTLDPDGAVDQQPVVLSTGWNNPYAFVIDDGQVVVADNAPEGEQERLGDLPFPETSQRAPSAIVVVAPGRYGVCGYLDGEMRGYRIENNEVERSGTLVNEGCRTSAARLPDGRFVVTDDESIRLVDA
jgi:hypothetical protein